MSIWTEIKCIHFDETEQKTFIDAYLTNDDWEEGKVIAKVDMACRVEYLDERAKTDAYAQEIINDARFDNLAKRTYDLYVKDWCKSRGYNMKDYDDENGFNGESFACFNEFVEMEFRDEDCMTHYLCGDIALWLEIVPKQSGKEG